MNHFWSSDLRIREALGNARSSVACTTIDLWHARYKQSSKAVNGYVLSRGAELKTDHAPIVSPRETLIGCTSCSCANRTHRVVGKYFPLHRNRFSTTVASVSWSHWRLYIARNLSVFVLHRTRVTYHEEIAKSERRENDKIARKMRQSNRKMPKIPRIFDNFTNLLWMKRDILTTSKALLLGARGNATVLSNIIPHLSRFY